MSVSKRRERLWQKKKNQWNMVKAVLVDAFDRAVHRAFDKVWSD